MVRIVIYNATLAAPMVCLKPILGTLVGSASLSQLWAKIHLWCIILKINQGALQVFFRLYVGLHAAFIA